MIPPTQISVDADGAPFEDIIEIAGSGDGKAFIVQKADGSLYSWNENTRRPTRYGTSEFDAGMLVWNHATHFGIDKNGVVVGTGAATWNALGTEALAGAVPVAQGCLRHRTGVVGCIGSGTAENFYKSDVYAATTGCGNGVCESSESNRNCSADCA